ncbi:MAG TPA: FG-GAP-like repeat-containing protein [Pyrinomonadaceae bacterium]|nr:FG-GAP-like repeat-containing protein [Pyrinomonadaceae bacterium]
MRNFLRGNAAQLVALAVIGALYVMARLPVITKAERIDLSSGFQFSQRPLPEVPGLQHKSMRTVNPSLSRIAGWVSATGAGVALNDLDGDGLSNDLCMVDPRSDRVIVAPVPDTGARYRPFVLEARELFDSATMAPMGCIPADLNEDGASDLLVYYWGRTPITFLAKTGGEANGTSTAGQSLSAATYKPVEIASRSERWFTGAATLADLDGDGHLDIVIGNYYADGARILDAKAGTKDQMQHSMTRAFNGGRSRVLRWAEAKNGSEPSVRFDEIQDYVDGTAREKQELTHGWTLALGASDLNDDLLPELYFANDFGPDRLLLNRSTPGNIRFSPLSGRKTLTVPNSKVLGRDGFKGMGVEFADINGDGHTDIFVSNIAAEYALEESNFAFINNGQPQLMQQGIAPFTDRSESLGLSRSDWSWDIKLGDFNNDGVPEVLQAVGFTRGEVNCWPELHELAMGNDQLIANPSTWFQINGRCGLSDKNHNPFFVRARDGRYYDIAPDLGLGRSEISRGIAIADVDADGRLDFALANQWEPSRMYRNESANSGAVLGLKLRLPATTTAETTVCSGFKPTNGPTLPAIGASVSVRTPDGRQFVSQVDGGNGHSGKRSPELHFGLGQVKEGSMLQVTVRWRDRNGAANQQALELLPGLYTVTLGDTKRRRDGCD